MLKKHSVSIQGHRTSYTLEDEFYVELKQISKQQDRSLSSLIREVDANRQPDCNLSSALRLYVLKYVKQT